MPAFVPSDVFLSRESDFTPYWLSTSIDTGNLAFAPAPVQTTISPPLTLAKPSRGPCRLSCNAIQNYSTSTGIIGITGNLYFTRKNGPENVTIPVNFNDSAIPNYIVGGDLFPPPNPCLNFAGQDNQLLTGNATPLGDYPVSYSGRRDDDPTISYSINRPSYLINWEFDQVQLVIQALGNWGGAGGPSIAYDLVIFSI